MTQQAMRTRHRQRINMLYWVRPRHEHTIAGGSPGLRRIVSAWSLANSCQRQNARTNKRTHAGMHMHASAHTTHIIIITHPGIPTHM